MSNHVAIVTTKAIEARKTLQSPEGITKRTELRTNLMMLLFTLVYHGLIERVFRQRASTWVCVGSCVGVLLPTRTYECVSCQIALLCRNMVCLYENRMARR